MDQWGISGYPKANGKLQSPICQRGKRASNPTQLTYLEPYKHLFKYSQRTHSSKQFLITPHFHITRVDEDWTDYYASKLSRTRNRIAAIGFFSYVCSKSTFSWCITSSMLNILFQHFWNIFQKKEHHHSVLHLAGGTKNCVALSLYKKFGFQKAPEGMFVEPNDHLFVLPDIHTSLCNTQLFKFFFFSIFWYFYFYDWVWFILNRSFILLV